MKFSPGPVALWEVAPQDASSLSWAAPLASAGAGVASAVIGSNAAKSAANTQAAAANQAISVNQGNYDQTRSDLSPYRDFGTYATGALANALPYLTSPTTESVPWMGQLDNLESLPGYTFTRDQGLKAVQNSAAAKGLGVSGAAMKGAADYATGLADSKWQDYWNGALNQYQTAFNADQTNKTNSFNRLYQAMGLGENAAATTGNLGSTYSNNATNLLTSSGNAAASGTVGSANALSSGLSSLGSSPMQYLIASKLFGGSGSSSKPTALSGADSYLYNEPQWNTPSNPETW